MATSLLQSTLRVAGIFLRFS